MDSNQTTFDFEYLKITYDTDEERLEAALQYIQCLETKLKKFTSEEKAQITYPHDGCGYLD